MTLPIATLLLGSLFGGLAVLVARAKRAVRLDVSGVSLDAQLRFRRAFVRFVCVMAVLATGLQASRSVALIQMGLAGSDDPGWGPTVMLAVLTVAFLVGCVWLTVIHGQGGARREESVSDLPLTDGLADNALWKWGLFYVNRDDPSILVEKRFGLGYTLNFGNPHSILLLLIWAAMAVVILGLAISAWSNGLQRT
jgi:uncharacterized membrane protein